MGPRETAVRAGLGERPCGALYAGEDAEASRLERVTFAALFNGAGQDCRPRASSASRRALKGLQASPWNGLSRRRATRRAMTICASFAS